MMHVAVDCDDVMLDFMGSVMKSFELEFGVTPDWDGSPWGPSAVAFTKHPAFIAAGYKNWWDWLRERDWLWGTFPAMPGAIGSIKTLRAQGHYVEMVTSKPEWAEPQVWRWLGKWRPPFNAVTITNSSQKQRKVDYTEADIIIDDKRATCEEFVKAGRRAIHYDHVGDSDWMPNLYPVGNWAQAVCIIGAIEEVRTYATR